VDEIPIRVSPVGSEIRADVETGPIVSCLRRGSFVNRRLGEHRLSPPDRKVWYEVVPKAAIHAPALDVVSGAIVRAQLADPACIQDLRRNARTKLSVGTEAARRDRRAKSRKRCMYRREIARQTRCDPALEFVENAGRGKRLPNHIAGCNSCANPNTKTTEGAFDVVDCQDPRRDEPCPRHGRCSSDG